LPFNSFSLTLNHNIGKNICQEGAEMGRIGGKTGDKAIDKALAMPYYCYIFNLQKIRGSIKQDKSFLSLFFSA